MPGQLRGHVKAKNSFWLDGGYDIELVAACPYHPHHKWWTFRLGDVVENCHNPDQLMTICKACYVPRCGTTADPDRCTLWRHHQTEHVKESGAMIAVGA
jgi:hypothetical protein